MKELEKMLEMMAELNAEAKAIKEAQEALKKEVHKKLDELMIEEYQSAEHSVKRSIYEKTAYEIPEEVKKGYAVKKTEIRLVIR